MHIEDQQPITSFVGMLISVLALISPFSTWISKTELPVSPQLLFHEIYCQRNQQISSK